MGSYGFMWFNIFGDMEEFEQIFSGGVGTGGLRRGHVIGSGSCSALVKVTTRIYSMLSISIQPFGTLLEDLIRCHQVRCTHL